MTLHLLWDIIIIFGLSLCVVLICRKLHIPELVGFLFTGVLVGPHGFGAIRQIQQVDMLAEIVVVHSSTTIAAVRFLRRCGYPPIRYPYIHHRDPPQSPIIGKTLRDLDFRRRWGIAVVAIQRQKQTLPVPDPEFAFQAGDTAILLGSQDDIAKVRTAFSA